MSLSEYPEISPEEEVPAGPAKPARGLIAPIMLLLLGVLVLAMLGVVEERWAASQPWIDALVFPSDVIEKEGRALVWARKVERIPASSESDPLKAAVKTLLETEGFGEEVSLPEYVFAIETPVASFAPLLASGRLPEPGQPEVLAGDLADINPITLDGVPFTVTGRLRGSVSGCIVDYMLPYHPDIAQFFSETAGATRGSFFVDGLTRVGDLLPPRKSEEVTTPPDFIGGQVRIPTLFAWAAWLGLILVAAGGITAYMRVFERLSLRPSVLFGPILRETVARPRLFAAMHIILFPTFFGAMAAGLYLPGLNYRLTEYMGFVFTQGDLSYIGEAYASGDILKATAATFINNYIVQTLGLTFAVSFFPIPLGVFKTLVSFGMVGFGMAPLWHGAAAGYAYHSITMVLELEAYVLACFAITLWPIRWSRTFFSSSPGHEIFTNLRIFFGGAILAGVMLAIAALYEATTLILLGGF